VPNIRTFTQVIFCKKQTALSAQCVSFVTRFSYVLCIYHLDIAGRRFQNKRTSFIEDSLRAYLQPSIGWLRGHRRDPVNASERWYTVRLEHQQGCAPQVDVSQSTRDVIPVLSACTSVDASKDVVLHDLGVVLVSQQRLEPILLERWADSVLVGVGHDGAREGEHGRGYEHE
jgi:hypothetical protein